MKKLQRTRLTVAALALSSLGLGSAAQADPFVGRLIGSVAAGMLVNGAIKSHDKKFAAQCRLYDREGMEVYLPCDSRRPLGEVLTANRPDTLPDGLAGGPPADVAPPAAYVAADDLPAAYAPPPPAAHYAPPPVRYAAPADADCGCAHDLRGGRAYGGDRVVGVYDAYEHSSVSYSYGSDYGYGLSAASSGFYPYGGVGYGAGGYGGYDDGRARVAGRDRNGFLTWAGKPVR